MVLNSNDDSLSMSPELGESPLVLRHLEPLTTTAAVQANTPSKFLVSNREKSNQSPGNSKHATLRQSARVSSQFIIVNFYLKKFSSFLSIVQPASSEQINRLISFVKALDE